MQKLADAFPKEESANKTPDVTDKTFLPTGVKHQLVHQDMNRRFQDFNRWSQLQSDHGSEDECPTFNNQAVKDDGQESMKSFDPNLEAP